MSRALLVSSVAVASYAVLSSVASLAVLAWWRTATSANQLASVRLFPAVAGVLLTLALVMPGYLAFEEPLPYEDVGPLLIALAAAGAALIAAGLAVGARAAVATWRLERRWLRSATAIDFDPPAGMPAFAIDSATPIVALIGVTKPKLIASRSVIEACDAVELAAIVAHERRHLIAGDNLTRWLIASAPDALRWTRVHARIATAWHDAAEDAADDAAAGDERLARANLAALLLKVARLAPGEPWAPALVSPFADPRDLDRRVRRLVQDAVDDAPNLIQRFARIATVVALSLVTVAVTNAAVLEQIHGIVESIVGFAR